MICPRCGTQNLEDARFCMQCGAQLTEAQPEGPTFPAAPPPRPRIRPAGWRTALLRGALAFVIVALFAEVLGVLTLLDADLSAVTLLERAALFFFGFNHVAVRFELPPFDFADLGGIPGAEVPPDLMGLGQLGAFDISASVAVAMLLATGLAVWLLYRGGRAAAAAADGPPWGGIVVGSTVGIPYALLTLALSFPVRFSVRIPEDLPFFSGGSLEIGPAWVPALLWPLVIGGVAGAAGGFAHASGSFLGSAWGRWAVGVLAGGRRMALAALAVSIVGLFVLSAANPGLFVDYFRGVGDAGGREGFLLILYTALLVPNMLVGLFFLGAGSRVLIGDYVDNNAVTLFSLPRFIEGFDPAGLESALDPFGLGVQGLQPGFPFAFGVAPPEYFFFILAPVASVLIGGRHAARRGAAVSPGEGAWLGAGAGAVFALLMLALAVLAGVGFRFTIGFGLEQSSVARFGPSTLLGPLIVLGWGLVGGAIAGGLGFPSQAAPRGGPPAPEGGPAGT